MSGVLFVLMACSKNEQTMEDLLTVDTLYTPAERVLPGSGQDRMNYIKVAGRDTIFGFYHIGSSVMVFHSFDGLKTSSVYEIPYGWRIIYFEKGNIIIYRKDGTPEPYNGFALQESTDYGSTFIDKIIKEPVYGEQTYTPVFKGLDSGLFITQMGYIFNVFKINGDSFQKTVSLEQNWDDLYYPKLLAYTGPNSLFFISYGASHATNHYACRSDDGGYTWQSRLIETLPPINNYHEFYSDNFLEVISAEKYMFYTTELKWTGEQYLKNMKVYFAGDAGINWMLKDFGFGGYINSVQFVNPLVGFILVKDSFEDASKMGFIYKTSDSGATWSALGDAIYANNITFTDENTGIAMCKNIVQITQDGGKTWKLLTYPTNPWY